MTAKQIILMTQDLIERLETLPITLPAEIDDVKAAISEYLESEGTKGGMGMNSKCGEMVCIECCQRTVPKDILQRGERSKKIIGFSKEHYAGEDWPPTDAAGFLAWFQDKLATIPEERRKAATIELTSSSEYGGLSYVEIQISYDYPETQTEKEAIRKVK